MEPRNVFAFLVFIQNIQGFFNPYEPLYLREVPVVWPYSYYYYPAYPHPQQPKQIQVSLFF